MTHIWDGQNMAVELSDGVLSAKYVRGVNLISSEGAGGAEYYGYNAHGDVVQVADANGNVVRTYEYDAFGVEKNPDAEDVNPWRYCGEYWDAETGTVYLRARYYQPGIGRFTQEDPVGAGLNWYVYGESNPLMFVDPLGLDSYVFYDPNVSGPGSGLERAELLKMELEEKYGTTCHIIAISSKEDVVKGWKKMGSQRGFSGAIDSVVITAHGGPGGIAFKDKNDAWISGESFGRSDIGLLDPKEIGYFISLSCNTGNNAEDNGINGENFVTDLMVAQRGIKKSIAAYGFVTIQAKSEASGWWIFSKTTKYLDISTATSSEGQNYPNSVGFKVYNQSENNGKLPKPEELGIDVHYRGITSLIDAIK